MENLPGAIEGLQCRRTRVRKRREERKERKSGDGLLLYWGKAPLLIHYDEWCGRVRSHWEGVWVILHYRRCVDVNRPPLGLVRSLRHGCSNRIPPSMSSFRITREEVTTCRMITRVTLQLRTELFPKLSPLSSDQNHTERATSVPEIEQGCRDRESPSEAEAEAGLRLRCM